MANKIGEWFLIGVIVVLVLILIVGLSGLLTMWAWNTFIVYMFGLKTIGFWQAIALNVLLSLVRGVKADFGKKKDA